MKSKGFLSLKPDLFPQNNLNLLKVESDCLKVEKGPSGLVKACGVSASCCFTGSREKGQVQREQPL